MDGRWKSAQKISELILCFPLWHFNFEATAYEIKFISGEMKRNGNSLSEKLGCQKINLAS